MRGALPGSLRLAICTTRGPISPFTNISMVLNTKFPILLCPVLSTTVLFMNHWGQSKHLVQGEFLAAQPLYLILEDPFYLGVASELNDTLAVADIRAGRGADRAMIARTRVVTNPWQELWGSIQFNLNKRLFKRVICTTRCPTLPLRVQGLDLRY